MTFIRPLLSIAACASFAAGSLFQLIVFDGESPLNGQMINAAGGAFYLGLSQPSTFCPPSTQCPAGTSTVFAGMNSLWV